MHRPLSFFLPLFLVAAFAGCEPQTQSTSAGVAIGSAGDSSAGAIAGTLVDGQSAAAPDDNRPSQDEPAAAAAPAAAVTSSSLPPNLWTRTTGVDWPAFLGPTGDGKSPEKGILTDWHKTGPKLLWHKPLGEGYGAPTIARGRLFQFDRFGDQARLYCLNAETGAELWKCECPTDYQDTYGYNNGPRCSPVVDGDRVYAFGADGMLLCCRVADGQMLWQVDTQKDFGVIQNFFGVGSTPVIFKDLLIVMVGGSPAEAQKLPPGVLDRATGDGSAIVAFDKLTGEVKYKCSDELAAYASLKLATVQGRPWCFAFLRGGLLGFDPATGQEEFHFPWRSRIVESVNASMPVVAGDEVLISECYGPGAALLKVTPGKSEVVWQDDERKRAKALQTHWNTPIYLDGHVYGCSGRHSEGAELRCLDWKTGQVVWSQRGLARTSLTWIDGHFLCLGEYGQLWLLRATPEKFDQVAVVDYSDPALGQQLLGQERPVLKSYSWAAPIVAHGLVYLRGDDRLVCLELIPQS